MLCLSNPAPQTSFGIMRAKFSLPTTRYLGEGHRFISPPPVYTLAPTVRNGAAGVWVYVEGGWRVFCV